MAKYLLGDREFPRKGDAVAYIQGLLNGAELGAHIDDPLVYALLDRHPHREDKVSRGVANIEVTSNDWGNRCFSVRTGDGDLIAFSFRECFKPSTPVQDAKAALRVEIAEQIADFRRTTPLVCALSGAPLTNERGRPDTAEVDHQAPATFDQIAELWAYVQGGWGKVRNHQKGQRRYLSDEVQRNDWQAWHRSLASLRLLSARAHRNVSGAGSQ